MRLHERQADYEHCRDREGMTVEEWERATGFPPFSVYPAARGARHPSSDGFFMYAPEVRSAAVERSARVAMGRGESSSRGHE